MQSESTTRVLLGAIALVLLLLLAQGAGWLGGSGAASGGGVSPTAIGRYRVVIQPTRGGALLVKTDTATGQVWRKSLTGDGPWVFVDEESRPDS